jgi:hypothetical protein
MMPGMTNEEIDRKLEDVDKSLDNQQTELVSHSDQIRELKEKYVKEIESLQGDIKNLAELVWCVIHRVRTQSLIYGIDDRHWNMVLALANKHGVALPGSQG